MFRQVEKFREHCKYSFKKKMAKAYVCVCDGKYWAWAGCAKKKKQQNKNIWSS